jgi:hypothetical protein
MPERSGLATGRPAAGWGRLAEFRVSVPIGVIANGEIWTVDDARRCREASGCDPLRRNLTPAPHGQRIVLESATLDSVPPGRRAICCAVRG